MQEPYIYKYKLALSKASVGVYKHALPIGMLLAVRLRPSLLFCRAHKDKGPALPSQTTNLRVVKPMTRKNLATQGTDTQFNLHEDNLIAKSVELSVVFTSAAGEQALGLP